MYMRLDNIQSRGVDRRLIGDFPGKAQSGVVHERSMVW